MVSRFLYFIVTSGTNREGGLSGKENEAPPTRLKRTVKRIAESDKKRLLRGVPPLQPSPLPRRDIGGLASSRVAKCTD